MLNKYRHFISYYLLYIVYKMIELCHLYGLFMTIISRHNYLHILRMIHLICVNSLWSLFFKCEVKNATCQVPIREREDIKVYVILLLIQSESVNLWSFKSAWWRWVDHWFEILLDRRWTTTELWPVKNDDWKIQKSPFSPTKLGRKVLRWTLKINLSH